VSNNIQIKNGDTINVSSTSGSSTNVTISGVSAASSSGDKNYEHDQSSASATWVVNHNLGKKASVSVVDSAGTLILCEVEYNSDSQITLTFDSPTAGKAYFN
jgi:hypothetical protein